MAGIVLIGGGGFSAEAAEVAAQNGFDVIGYVDGAKTESHLPFLGSPEDFLPSIDKSICVFPAFGAVDRKGLLRRADSLASLSGFKIPSLVSKHAYVSSSVTTGAGAFVSHGVVINPFTQVGDFTIINSSSTIGHNVILSEYSIISGKVFLGGGCKIGPKTLIGPGVTVLQNINIGAEVIVSIGSTIGRNISSGKTTVPVLSRVVG